MLRNWSDSELRVAWPHLDHDWRLRTPGEILCDCGRALTPPPPDQLPRKRWSVQWVYRLQVYTHCTLTVHGTHCWLSTSGKSLKYQERITLSFHTYIVRFVLIKSNQKRNTNTTFAELLAFFYTYFIIIDNSLAAYFTSDIEYHFTKLKHQHLWHETIQELIQRNHELLYSKVIKSINNMSFDPVLMWNDSTYRRSGKPY